MAGSSCVRIGKSLPVGSMTHANTLGDLRSAPASVAPATSRLCIFLAVLLGLGIALSLGRITYLQVITFHPLPHLDEWRTLILFSRVEQNSDAWSLLLVPHAEHRPFLPRLIFLLDSRLAHGTGALSLAAIDFLLLGIVPMWSFLLGGGADRNERVRLTSPAILILCIAALLLSGHQLSNFVRGFQVAMFMVYFFAILSFAAFACAFRPAVDGRAAQSLPLVLL